jgi:hypothetical protein
MGAKNRLTVGDAEHVERAFQERLVSITNHAAAPSISNAERPSRRPGRRARRRRSVIDKSVLALPAPRRIRDREHVKSIPKQPCLVCGRRPADAHHLRFVQSPALGRKVSDEFTVPLARCIAAVTRLRGGTKQALMRPPLLRALVEDTSVTGRSRRSRRKITKRTQFDELPITSYRRPIVETPLRALGPKLKLGSIHRAATLYGLTADTVVGALEDAEDYEAFEAGETGIAESD